MVYELNPVDCSETEIPIEREELADNGSVTAVVNLVRRGLDQDIIGPNSRS